MTVVFCHGRIEFKKIKQEGINNGNEYFDLEQPIEPPKAVDNNYYLNDLQFNQNLKYFIDKGEKYITVDNNVKVKPDVICDLTNIITLDKLDNYVSTHSTFKKIIFFYPPIQLINDIYITIKKLLEKGIIDDTTEISISNYSSICNLPIVNEADSIKDGDKIVNYFKKSLENHLQNDLQTNISDVSLKFMPQLSSTVKLTTTNQNGFVSYNPEFLGIIRTKCISITFKIKTYKLKLIGQNFNRKLSVFGWTTINKVRTLYNIDKDIELFHSEKLNNKDTIYDSGINNDDYIVMSFNHL